jgi:hypothetical protein
MTGPPGEATWSPLSAWCREHRSSARKVSESPSARLRSAPPLSITRACSLPRNSSSTGGGATVTRRPAACVGPCSDSPTEKQRSCPRPSELKARCCCAKSRATTSRTRVPKSIESRPSHTSRYERPAVLPGFGRRNGNRRRWGESVGYVATTAIPAKPSHMTAAR